MRQEKEYISFCEQPINKKNFSSRVIFPLLTKSLFCNKTPMQNGLMQTFYSSESNIKKVLTCNMHLILNSQSIQYIKLIIVCVLKNDNAENKQTNSYKHKMANKRCFKMKKKKMNLKNEGLDRSVTKLK